MSPSEIGVGVGVGRGRRGGAGSPFSISAPSEFSFESGAQPYDLSGISFGYSGDGADEYTVTIETSGGGTFTAAASSPPTVLNDSTANVTFAAGTTLAQANSAINGAIDGLVIDSANLTITITNDETSEQAVLIVTLTPFVETLTGLRFPENNNESAFAGTFGSIQQPIANFPTVLDGADTNSGAGAFFAVVRVPLPRMAHNHRHLLLGSGTNGNNQFSLSVYSRDFNAAGNRGRAELYISDASGNSVSVLSEPIDEEDVLLVGKLDGDDWSIDWYSLTDGTKHAGIPTQDVLCTGISSHAPATNFIVGGVGSDTSANPKNLTATTGWWVGDILDVGYVDADIADATWQALALGGDAISLLGSANLGWYRKLTDKSAALSAVASGDTTNDMTLLDGGNIKLGSAIKRQSTAAYLTIDPIASGRVFAVDPGASDGVVSVSGKVGGFTGDVEIRLIDDDNVTVQQDWQTVGAISAGTFSGDVTCDKTSGWTFVEARVVGTTRPVARNAEYIGVGYKIGIIGQSQAQYLFTRIYDSLGLTISEANNFKVSMSNYIGTEQAITGVDFHDLTYRLGVQQFNDGMAQMVNQYAQYGDDTPLQIVNHAEPGTSARSWNDDADTGRYWENNPSAGAYDTIDILNATGADYTILPWQWGTSDNVGAAYDDVFDGVVKGIGPEAADHYLNDGDFRSGFEIVLSPFTRTEISSVASEDPDAGSSYWNTRKAQRSYAATEGWAIGPETGDIRIDSDTGPHPEPTDALGIRRFAERMAIAFARGLGLDTSTDPSISSVQFTDGNEDTILVTFNLPNGGSLTTYADDNDVRGFEISDDNGVSWSKDGFTGAASGNSVLLSKTTGSWAGGGDTLIRYMWGSPGSYGTGDSEQEHLDGLLYETYATAEFDGALPVIGTYAGSVGQVTVSDPNPQAPVAGTAPVISGSLDVGDVLSTTNGTWGPAVPTPTYAYQWKRGGVNIGLDQNTYTLTVADAGAAITCEVTATNSEGSDSNTSNTLNANALSGPTNTVAPVASGTPQDGEVLSVTTGTWTGNDTPTLDGYQWQADTGSGYADISGETSSTYTLDFTGDSLAVDDTVRCVVTFTNANGDTSANSNALTLAASNQTFSGSSGDPLYFSLTNDHGNIPASTSGITVKFTGLEQTNPATVQKLIAATSTTFDIGVQDSDGSLYAGIEDSGGVKALSNVDTGVDLTASTPQDVVIAASLPDDALWVTLDGGTTTEVTMTDTPSEVFASNRFFVFMGNSSGGSHLDYTCEKIELWYSVAAGADSGDVPAGAPDWEVSGPQATAEASPDAVTT